MSDISSSSLVVIPTYNEEGNISQIISEVFSLYPEVSILVMDDSSPDQTIPIVKKLQTKYPKNLFLNIRPKKLGLGSAYLAGFAYGMAHNFQYIIEMDADFSHNPKYLKTMFQLLETSDFVIGSRYIAGGGTENWSFTRKLISQAGSIYARLVLGLKIHDCTGGFNGWNKSLLEKIDLNAIHSDGYAFQIELKYRAICKKATFKEFPIIFADRRAGQSKMSFKIILEAIWKLWLIRFF